MSSPSSSTTDVHWIRPVVDEILRRNDERIVVHTGKTPSGPIHIGAEREQFICSAIQRELKRRGHDSDFNFIIDSFDPIKSVPAGLEVPKGFDEHIGKPLSDVPDPFGCHESYAHHFAEEFINCQQRLGLSPKIVYSHELYRTTAMKDAIRTVLRRIDDLRAIRREYIQQHEEDGAADDWNPVMVVCEKCGKIASKKKDVSPNRVTRWDLARDEILYSCTSCGHEGVGKISDLRLKLSWRVDWTAKWAVFKVTCEPAGKDHCVKDGAYDMGIAVSQRIFGYKGPLRVSYEWLTLGEHAMKTHKGITFTPMEWLRIATPESMRYLILSADPMRHIAFLPDRIPDIVDNFDRLERIAYRAEEPTGVESRDYLDALYAMCTVREPPERLPARLPYRFAVTTCQLEPLLGMDSVESKSEAYAAKLYSRGALTEEEAADVRSRLSMARNWVASYAPQNVKFQISTADPTYRPSSDQERRFLEAVVSILERDMKEADIQNEVFNTARGLNLEMGKAFSAIYRVLLGSERGPRLAPLLTALDRDWAIKRIKSVL